MILMTMAHEGTDEQRPRLSLVGPATPQPPRFAVHARIRSLDGDEPVAIAEIVLHGLPPDTPSGSVRVVVGDVQPLLLCGQLTVRPDGTAVLRPIPENPNRSAFRVPVACPVIVERPYRRGVLECATVNLSVVGALLDDRAGALGRGERVAVTITLPTGPVVLRATVVGHDDELRAVRFEDEYPPGAEAALAHFLTELQRRDLARRR